MHSQYAALITILNRVAMLSFFEIPPQCCDAEHYVISGIECALNGVCYGDVRPVGDYLWFAIPTVFGWPVESLSVINCLLMLVSVLLSVRAFYSFSKSYSAYKFNKLAINILLLLSLAVHGVFLFPTIFNTLADPPANLLLLSGIWLLMIAHFNNRAKIHFEIQLFISGLLIGWAVWLRAFYLYPVLLGCAAYFIGWLFSGKKLRELLFFVALLPIGTQYFIMYQAYGSYSYLGKEVSGQALNMHLNSWFVGYDTILPNKGYSLVPPHCTPEQGVVDALAINDYQSITCVVAGRLYFYLGTYNRSTFLLEGNNTWHTDPARQSVDSVRQWQPELLCLHIVMLLMAAAAIIGNRTFWLQQRTGICIFLIVSSAVAESTVIIPEQRFAVGWMIFFWLVAIAYTLSAIPYFKNKKS